MSVCVRSRGDVRESGVKNNDRWEDKTGEIAEGERKRGRKLNENHYYNTPNTAVVRVHNIYIIYVYAYAMTS